MDKEKLISELTEKAAGELSEEEAEAFQKGLRDKLDGREQAPDPPVTQNRIITSTVGGGFKKNDDQVKPMKSIWDFLKEKL